MGATRKMKNRLYVPASRLPDSGSQLASRYLNVFQPSAGNGFTNTHRRRLRRRNRPDFMSRREQMADKMRTDETIRPGHEALHQNSFFVGNFW
jgi:hypothetical protein